MTVRLAAALRGCRDVLIDPRRAFVVIPPFPWVLVVLLLLLVVAGVACLPRQLEVLARALAPTGDPSLDAHYALMRAGLTRVMVADRLVPSPTMVTAAVLLVALVEPIAALSRERRPVIWTIVALGLLPIVLEQIGELATTWIAPVSDRPTPGQALTLPHRFETGPLLLWRGPDAVPAWLQVLDARVNLISLWCVALWTMGLRAIDHGRLRAWHVAAPVVSLALAGVVTWQCGPVVLALVLGTP